MLDFFCEKVRYSDSTKSVILFCHVVDDCQTQLPSTKYKVSAKQYITNFIGVKIVRKQFRRSKFRRLSMLLVVALIVSCLPLQGIAPLPRAEAATPCTGGVAYSTYGPGGVNCGLLSWVDMDQDLTLSGSIIKSVKDQVEYYYQNNPTTYPNKWDTFNKGAINLYRGAINFHNAAQFDGAHFIRTQFLDMNAGEIFSVQKNDGSGFPWDFGGTYNSASTYSGNTINTYFGRKETMVSTPNIPYNLAVPSILNAWSATNNWGLALNGDLLQQLTQNTTHFTPTYPPLNSYYIGAINGKIFENGRITENIFYNRTLSIDEKQRVNSYLALKYGLTAKDADGNAADYVASDGTAFWAANDNAGYGNRITGIGRDDASKQNQKQSKSQLNDAILTIALGANVATTNSGNTETIGADKSFFVFGDNDGAAAYNTSIARGGESLKRMDRIYKVDKTNWIDTSITLQVDNPKGPAYLVVSSDAAFDGSDTFIPMTAPGKVTLNSTNFADGSYMTFAVVVSQPAALAVDDAADKLTVTFTREVMVTNLLGFTVNVNGDQVTPVSFSVDSGDSKKLVITLPANSYNAGDGATVTYDGSGNLTDKNNGLKVANFSIVFVDKSVLQAEVDLAATLKKEDYTPESWKSYEDALTHAKEVLKDINTTQNEVNDAFKALEQARLALTTNKDELQQTVDSVNEAINSPGFEDTYTSQSRGELQKALDEAQKVLADEKATQQQIDAVNKALKDAYDNLVTIEALIDKLDLTVANSGNNEEIALSPQFDGNKYLVYEASVGDDVDSVAVALELLNFDSSAKLSFNGKPDIPDTEWSNLLLNEGLNMIQVEVTAGGKTNIYTVRITKTDKRNLQSKVSEINNESLNGAEYTEDSWNKLQEALGAADQVLNNPKATQGDVDNALEALQKARDGLVVKPAQADKSMLQETVDKVENEKGNGTLKEDNYTLESWAELQKALDVAKGVLNYPGATQQQIDDAKKAVEDAYGKLVFVDKLVSLTPSTGTLSPKFDSAVGSYTMSVPNSVTDIIFNPVALDRKTKIEIRVNGGAYAEAESGKASTALPLNVGTNTVTVRITGQDGKIVKEYVVTVIRETSGNYGGGETTSPSTGSGTNTGTGAGSTAGSTTDSNTSGVTTTVNGKDSSFATGDTKTDGEGKHTTVKIDGDKLSGILSQGDGQKLAIDVPNDGDTKVKGLTAADVKKLADTGSTLEIEDLLAIYPVPAKQLDLDAIARQWDNAKLDDIAVEIRIKRSPQPLADSARKQAAAEGFELLVSPVDLDLTFSHESKTIRAGQLERYAVKYIALPEGIDPKRITTGVAVNPDGTMFHVPTVVTKISNRYFAQINDLRSQGTYSVIWNPQDFDDAKGHWGKADVNNIAARLDLAGTGNNTFSPDRNVTRSEFSEIVVLGLGLMRQNAPQSMFPDVPASVWYRDAVAIAAEFDIVRGYNDGNFYGDQQITREQGIAMVARAYNLIDSQAALSENQTTSLLAKYKDAASVSAWARADVAKMIAAGIVQGDGPKLLSPQSNMTRAEVTALIARLLRTTELIDK